MNGVHAATWSVRAGVHQLHYAEGWLNHPSGRPVSLSLPFVPGNLAHRGDVVENFFDNLLPDSVDIRKRLQAQFGCRMHDTFSLLTAIGRDCVGAVQLLPPEMAPDRPFELKFEPLTARDVERILDATTSKTRFHGEEADDFRISLAGAQEKTALLFHKNRWCRPLGATPTTHILKLPLGLVGSLQVDMKDSVENEWLCAEILREFGVPVANCQPARFGERRVLVVERFDRARQREGWIARLPQEDFCQALGIPSSLKYENQGGPGMKDILRLLVSSVEPRDAARFVQAQLLFWALAATDGHGKNFSLFHLPGGGYRMTPLYDVLSTWPIIGRGPRQLQYRKLKLAMAVRSKNVHYELAGIRRRHWDAVAKLAGLKDASAIVDGVVSDAPRALNAVKSRLPRDFPVQVSELVFRGVTRSLDELVH